MQIIETDGLHLLINTLEVPSHLKVTNLYTTANYNAAKVNVMTKL